MTAVKNGFFKKVLSVMFALMTMFSVFAITAPQAAAYSGSESFVVTTKANYWYPGKESITVKQSKEKYYSKKDKSKTKTRNALVCTVKCVPTSWTGKKPATITKSFSGSSKTISLEKNVTYRVTVTWNSVICANHWGTVDAGYAYISGAHKAKWSYT